MNEYLQPSPEDEGSDFISLHSGLCEVVSTPNEIGLYWGFTFLAHGFPPYFLLYIKTWILSTLKLLEGPKAPLDYLPPPL